MSQPDPRDTDAILGGQNPPPVNAAVLGGLAGVKQRLESESIAERLHALNRSVDYGRDGIDLVLRALTDDNFNVRKLAKKLLRDRFGEAGREALLESDVMGYFTNLDDWKQETYDPEIGILDPENTAYLINLEFSYTSGNSITTECNNTIECLLEDLKTTKIQALIVNVELAEWQRGGRNRFKPFQLAIDYLNRIYYLCPELKLLYFGDFPDLYFKSSGERRNISLYNRSSRFFAYDITPILTIFSHLEILCVFANFDDTSNDKKDTFVNNYKDANIEIINKKLKTLIINGDAIFHKLYSICSHTFLELEYFQIWVKSSCSDSGIIDRMLPVLSGYSMPKLKYFGIYDWECLWEVTLKAFLKSPILESLDVLDLNFGVFDNYFFTDIDMKVFNSLSLKVLDFSNNCFSDEAIQKMQNLPCQVIIGDRYFSKQHRENKLGYN